MENTTPTLVVQRKEYEAMLAEVAELRLLVEYYRQQLLLSKRRQFGSSSEQSDVEGIQLDLFGGACVTPPPEAEEEITYRRKKRFEAILKKLPAQQRQESAARQGVAYINALFDLEFLLTVLPSTAAGNLESLLPWSEALPEYCRVAQRKEVQVR
ncbi:MAG: hypothetical protein LBS32_06045 [Clostridiales Family XIII bacterium]|jgi:hypothetical protein|nr:hypothetical protein [Clostridiales Family XIII bacterium]